MQTRKINQRELERLQPGDQVQVNSNPNSQVYFVVEHNGRTIGLAYYEGKRLCRTQYHDHSIVWRKVNK